MAGVFFQPRILGLGIILSLTLRLRVALSKLLETSNSEEKIAMLKYEEAFPNVLRFRLDGSIVWQAELPTQSNDVYTNLEWMDGKLHAFSRSCMSVLLDENTGKIVSGK
jgi:hypothetical protein